jgi:hypothetical protein
VFDFAVTIIDFDRINFIKLILMKSVLNVKMICVKNVVWIIYIKIASISQFIYGCFVTHITRLDLGLAF